VSVAVNGDDQVEEFCSSGAGDAFTGSDTCVGVSSVDAGGAGPAAEGSITGTPTTATGSTASAGGLASCNDIRTASITISCSISAKLCLIDGSIARRVNKEPQDVA